MKTFLLIICILIASADGFIAVYDALRRTVWGGERRAFEKKNSKLVCVNPIDILDVGVVYELLGGNANFLTRKPYAIMVVEQEEEIHI